MARASSDIVRFVFRGANLLTGAGPICPVVSKNFVVLGVDIMFIVTTGTLTGGGSFSVKAGDATVATGAVLPTTLDAFGQGGARFDVTPAMWALDAASEGSPGIYLTVDTTPTGSGGLNVGGTLSVWGYFAP